jgi:hypothetical protein
VDGVGQQLLAGAGFAQQQHRRVTGRSAPRAALGFRLAALLPTNWAKLYLAWRARSCERVEASSCCMLE